MSWLLFQTTRTGSFDGPAEHMYTELGVPCLTQNSDPPPQALTLPTHLPFNHRRQGLTFNYNNVWLCHDSHVLWAKRQHVCGSTDEQQLVSQSQQGTELPVKMEALIRLCFSYVTETPIRAWANAHFTHFSGLTQEYESSLFHIIIC